MRPTSDRVREAAFNTLASLGVVAGARVVDLFAGSGALGIEALSRGAASAVFVEPDRAARAVLEENLRTVGFADDGRCRVVATTAETYLGSAAAGSHDLALLDPPYVFSAWADLFARLDTVMTPDGVVVVESDRVVDPSETDAPAWQILRSRRYGGTVLGINVRTEPSPCEPGAEP